MLNFRTCVEAQILYLNFCRCDKLFDILKILEEKKLTWQILLLDSINFSATSWTRRYISVRSSTAKTWLKNADCSLDEINADQNNFNIFV